MDYEGIVYRPPSEARSLIIQVTIGCAHNTCGFCMANSVEKFTDDGFKGSVDEKTGQFIFHFTGTVSAESKLLMDSLILGLTDIAESYGDKYIKIRFREV